MPTRRNRLVAPVMCVIVLLASCSGGSNSKGPAPRTDMFITAADLGEGWRGEAPRPFDPATADLLRLCGQDVNSFGSASSVVLANGTRGDVVTSIIGHFDVPEQARAAVQRISDAGTACQAWDLDTADVTIGVVNYGFAGQGAVAFRLVITGKDRNLNADYFVWHRGNYAAAILNTATVLLDPEVTKTAINAADRLLLENG